MKSKKETILENNAMQYTRMERLKKDYGRNWRLYLFLVLPLIYIAVFAYYPMAGLQIAFKNYDFTKGIWGSDWIGFDHFERFFSGYNFWSIMKNTISLSLYNLIAGFPLPIIFALMLNSFPGVKFKKLVQSVTYMPHFISTVVIVGMITQLFNTRIGLFGVLYNMIFGTNMPDLLGSASAFQHMHVWSGIWQGLGYSSIIYMAALAGVDEELHEAAQIDGASRIQRVRHIDFPSILPTVTIMLILASGRIMSVGFEKVYLMQNTLNISKSEVVATYVYKVGVAVGGGDFGFATAVGLFDSIINFILLLLVNLAAKKLSNTSLW